MALIKIDIDDYGLTDRFSRAEDLIPDKNRDGVKHVTDLGQDKARELAPYEIGYLWEAITATPATGGVYAEAEVYIQGGVDSHGTDVAVYGYFQDHGYHHHGNGEFIQNQFMEPATTYLEGGVAELALDQAMYLALSEAGLEPGIGGLVGA